MISYSWTAIAGCALAVAGLVAPAHAAEDAPVCTGPVALSAALAPWAQPVARAAAGSAAGLAKAGLVVGQALNVTLLATPDVTYPLRPEKPGGSVSYGGLLRLVVTERGAYRVALGSPAWIDLVDAAGAAMVSTGHGRGPACTGVHKMVDFTLAPGAYTLQISANGAPQTEVLVVRQP